MTFDIEIWRGWQGSYMKSCRNLLGDPVPVCQNGSVECDAYFQGVRLLNQGSFFDAHEVLEDVWRDARQPERKFLQGLIQIAVALYHHGNGNLVGARSVLRRAGKNLAGYPENFGGIRLTPLRRSLSRWQRALDDGKSVPAFPKLLGSVSRKKRTSTTDNYPLTSARDVKILTP